MSLKNCRSLLPENCVYKESGCNLKFPSTYEVAVHIKQCQFRPYKCVGQTLKVWICTWSGLQDDLPSHFLSSHAALGNALPYLAHSFIPFKSDVTYSTLNLVDACGRKFVFYYNSNSNTQMVYFIIFLIGSKDEASQYVYEFEIKSPAEKYRKVIIKYNLIQESEINYFTLQITVVEESVSDSQPKEEIFKLEKCVALSHMAIRNYLYEGNIHFRFTISKKEEIADKLSDKMLAEMTNVKLRTSHSVHSSTRKGKVSVNISKKNTEHTSVPLPLISSINKKPPPIILTGRSISLEPSMQECSSINKLSPSDNAISRGDQTPCLIASINKQESVDENVNYFE